MKSFPLPPSLRRLLLSSLAAMTMSAMLSTATAADTEPIRIGVMAPEKAPQGLGNIRGVQLAADEINKAGGIDGRMIELFVYDTEASAPVAVRNFQRMVKQDKVVAVMGTWTSEESMAVQPWSSRYKIPFIVGSSGTPELTRNVKKDYEKNKYTFHLIGNAILQAEDLCEFIERRLVKELGAKTAIMLDEDSQWTIALIETEKRCLPAAGLEILDIIKFAENTTDFAPIFNKIRSLKPDLIVTGLSHTGLQATIQWAQQEVPALMVGMNSIAISKGFWKQSNGLGNGVITQSGPLEGTALTAKTLAFFDSFHQKFGPDSAPSLAGSTYDGMYMYADAVRKAGTTDADAVVAALEQVERDGVMRDGIRFFGRDEPFPHGTNMHFQIIQWQDGERVYVDPPAVEQPIKLPAFVKFGQ